MKLRHINLMLPPEMFRELAQYCATHDTNKREVIMELLRKLLEKEKAK